VNRYDSLWILNSLAEIGRVSKPIRWLKLRSRAGNERFRDHTSLADVLPYGVDFVEKTLRDRDALVDLQSAAAV
jgi:hypothetical protein